jgi:uncharacterized protein (DUF1778 family)
MAYTGYTEAQGKATQRYKQKNLEELRVTIRKGGKQALKEAADAVGMSVAEYVCEAVNMKAGRQLISSKKLDNEE